MEKERERIRIQSTFVREDKGESRETLEALPKLDLE